MRKFSNNSLSRLKGVHPALVTVLGQALQSCPLDFGIASGVRTSAEQQDLYARGRTTPGQIVTNCDGVNKKSNHQAKADGFGHAVDIYGWNGKALWDKNSLTIIANHIMASAIGHPVILEWGGEWKMKDYPHIELVKYGYH